MYIYNALLPNQFTLYYKKQITISKPATDRTHNIFLGNLTQKHVIANTINMTLPPRL